MCVPLCVSLFQLTVHSFLMQSHEARGPGPYAVTRDQGAWTLCSHTRPEGLDLMQSHEARSAVK